MKDIIKAISQTQFKFFGGASRFDDAILSEWHVISTAHPDHYGDVMVYGGMELPPAGKGIALLNHDPFWSGGLPIGKVLEYRVVKGDDGVEQLWQHTQYLPGLPDDIGTKTYNVRKAEAFTDSSIQFRPLDIEPVDPEDSTKDCWNWKGTRYKRWQLVEAGPVLVGANWNTGDMKDDQRAVVKALMDTLPMQLKRRVEELEAENARLRKQLEPVRYRYTNKTPPAGGSK